MVENSQPIQHFMVPEHIKLTDEEKETLLKKYNISLKQLPMMKASDAALKNMNVRINDVILIKRKSATAKEAEYFRVVVDG